MELTDFLILLIQLLIIALFFIFKNSAPAYLKKKSENLATIQDIKNITKEVKSVEIEFSEKLSTFQADLNIIKHHNQKLGDEERELLINLYRTCSKTAFMLKGTKFKPAKEYGLPLIDEEIKRLLVVLNELIEIKSNCELFIKESELLIQAFAYLDQTVDFTERVILFFKTYHGILKGNQGRDISIETLKKADPSANPHLNIPELIAGYEENSKEMLDYLDRFTDSKNNEVKSLYEGNLSQKRNFILAFKNYYNLAVK